MNPYYMIGIIAFSMMIYALLVAAVSLTGISVGVAMIIVYAIILFSMFSMQKRARQAYVPQVDRRRSAASSTVGLGGIVPVELGQLAEQQAANQDSPGISAVGAADAR